MEPNASAARFVTTHWSVVLAAGGSHPGSQAALETLCRACWQPVYAYVRRLGHEPEEARDLTQAFFAQLLARTSIANARPEMGRFRSFLLGALKHFLADAHDRAHALKRGGGREIFSLDVIAAESSYEWEPADQATPERIYERRWALNLIATSLNRLEEECRLTGKAHLFEALRTFLVEGTGEKSYPQIAAELGLTEAAVRMTVVRLRRRHGELVRSEVEDTLGSRDDLEDELRHLLKLLRDG